MRNLVVKYVPKKWYPVANIILKVEEKKVFVTKTVRELLFDGYADELLNLTKKLERILKIKIPFDKFGWFYNVSIDLFVQNTSSQIFFKMSPLPSRKY